MNTKTSFVIGTILLVLVSVSALRSTSDQITNLPGLPKINFKQYSGYVEVAPGRFLFYWFVESQRNPATDKLVLWLNGGPGCSSIGGGLMTENGPFRVNPDGATISLNPNSWNTVANVIYLESPAGVGYSYSENQSDYTVGDKRTAEDSYMFLQGFLERFPQYNNTPFWVAGESYGGHYVPELAKRIYDGNQEGTYPKINLEGFMAGNPWTYMPFDNYGAVFYWWTHALISDATFNGLKSYCNFSDIGPLGSSLTDVCVTYQNDATAEMGDINIYDIYVDMCNTDGKIIKQMARAGSPLHKSLDKALGNSINPPYLPCADAYTETYMNRDDVKKAIHADKDLYWLECSNVVSYNYSDVEASVIPIYEFFFDNTDLQILVFSGDVDAIVPVTGTRAWIASMNRSIKESWTPYMVNEQTGGYYTVYDRFTFATVRNAGHMVPQFQPQRALHLFNRFLYKGHL